ncbi:MAG TPA: TIGR00730 family Rossman fold protein [Candidatus Saccharibacteria bacterium]|nr:TIGR00730 family Rossman fold protein [Candidatus Saccharibacteria bacterium]HMR38205.1 TIGR00730 family Rossman fold protein [Candidatus Saccharibacteria bacterium]
MQPKPTTDIKKECIERDIMLQAAMYRLGNIEQEIQAGYNILRKYPKTITVFGSARLPEDNHWYQQAKELSKRLAQKEYTIVTGGGHGIMGASNQGANEANGNSIGFNIELPHEQTLNGHTTESLSFSHFAPRKITMTLYASGYVYFPGGFGTLDELMEILTLIQTGKTLKAPIILFGHDFWDEFDHFVKKSMLEGFPLITPGDQDLYVITDSIDEAVSIIEQNDRYNC